MTTYQALRDRCREASPGSALPSEVELCAEYGVSRITIRKAVELLANEGIVRKEQGRGTFVSQPDMVLKYRESFVDAIRGYYTDLTRRGHAVGTTVVFNGVRPATPVVATELDLPVSTPIVYLRRVRTVDGSLSHVGDASLPAKRFPELVNQDFSDGSLYEHLAASYGIKLTSSHFVVEVGFADREIAALLAVSEGSPMLVVHATVKDEMGLPVVYGTSWFMPQASQVEFATYVQRES